MLLAGADQDDCKHMYIALPGAVSKKDGTPCAMSKVAHAGVIGPWQGTDSMLWAAALTWKPPQMPTTSSVGRSHLQAERIMPKASCTCPGPKPGALEDEGPSSAVSQAQHSAARLHAATL